MHCLLKLNFNSTDHGQVMGCVGVPLYKIYQRKTEWRTVRPAEAEERGVRRDDSVDDMIAQVKLQKRVSS